MEQLQELAQKKSDFPRDPFASKPRKQPPTNRSDSTKVKIIAIHPDQSIAEGGFDSCILIFPQLLKQKNVCHDFPKKTFLFFREY